MPPQVIIDDGVEETQSLAGNSVVNGLPQSIKVEGNIPVILSVKNGDTILSLVGRKLTCITLVEGDLK